MIDGLVFARVPWNDPRAQRLRESMLAELVRLYPRLGDSSASGDSGMAVAPEDVVCTVLAIADGRAVAHAAIRTFGSDLEVKRVFVEPEVRGTGVGAALMGEVELVAIGLGAPRLVLHTGDKQPAAVRMYERLGYTPIPLYQPYATTMPHSFCFEKVLGRQV